MITNNTPEAYYVLCYTGTTSVHCILLHPGLTLDSGESIVDSLEGLDDRGVYAEIEKLDRSLQPKAKVDFEAQRGEITESTVRSATSMCNSLDALPIDRGYTIETNEGLIGIVDSQGRECAVYIDGVKIRPLKKHPARSYSATGHMDLGLGGHCVEIRDRRGTQAGVYTCDLKPEPRWNKELWVSVNGSGDESGDDEDNTLPYDNLLRINLNTFRVAGTEVTTGTRVTFLDGTYKLAARDEPVYLRQSHILVRAKNPGRVIFDGSYGDSTWSNTRTNNIYSAPLLGDESTYVQVIDTNVRIPYWNDLNDLTPGRSGWTKDDNNVYVRLVDGSAPDSNTVIASDVRPFHVDNGERVKFSGITCRHYRKRGIRASGCKYLNIDSSCVFEFIHDTALYMHNCPEPKVEATFTDDLSQTAWHQMKRGLHPYYTPSGLTCESSTAVVCQTGSGASTPGRRGVFNLVMNGVGDGLILRDNGDFGMTLHQVTGDYFNCLDNPIVDNRLALLNFYVRVNSLGHDAFAWDSDGYGPNFILGMYGVYGYEHSNAIDPDVDNFTENAIKRIRSHHVEVLNQCTLATFHVDGNDQTACKSEGVAHPYLEATNCIFLGEWIHQHRFNSVLVLDGNIYHRVEETATPYEHNGNKYATLLDWQRALRQDANTIEMDPQLDSNGIPQAVGIPDAIANPLNLHNRRGAKDY